VGREGKGKGAGVDANADTGDALDQAWQQLETPGQYFRLKVMEDLFSSTSRLAEHRP
jgi:hypothetical protein